MSISLTIAPPGSLGSYQNFQLCFAQQILPGFSSRVTGAPQHDSLASLPMGCRSDVRTRTFFTPGHIAIYELHLWCPLPSRTSPYCAMLAAQKDPGPMESGLVSLSFQCRSLRSVRMCKTDSGCDRALHTAAFGHDTSTVKTLASILVLSWCVSSPRLSTLPRPALTPAHTGHEQERDC